MTIKKAKLYRTARIIDDAWDLPAGFKAGEYVSAAFLRKVFGSYVFQCSKSDGSIAAISDFELENFVL